MDAFRLITLYQEMYEFTLSECKESCRARLSCCSFEYCDEAERWAKEKWNIQLLPVHDGSVKVIDYSNTILPFMGDDGCVVLPHLRPMCTLHTCDINSMGYSRKGKEWDDKYWKLREEIMVLESEREGEENS